MAPDRIASSLRPALPVPAALPAVFLTVLIAFAFPARASGPAADPAGLPPGSPSEPPAEAPPGPPAGEPTPNLLHQGLPYGSQAAFNPFFVLVNGAYDMLQTGVAGNRIATLNYAAGFRNVNRNLAHPLENIRRYGWGEFARNELLPTGPGVEDAQWVPNYTLHMIGGGLTYRSLAEWYALQGAPRPRVWAALNCFAYHYVNEAIENGKTEGPNVDAIADFLVFNPLGILLFSNDAAAGFFGRTLHAANWSSLPALNLRTGRLDNMALSFSFKWFPSERAPVGFHYYTGMNTSLGLTWRYAGEYSLSAGGGVGTVGVYQVDQLHGERKMTAALGKTLGVYWDRNNSLLASLIVSEQRMYRARLNVYPLPAMASWRLKPGFFLGYGRDGDAYLGVSVNLAPLGLSPFLVD
jgi:hypothetical protein